MSIALCLLVGRRWPLVRDRILPTVLDQGFDDVLVLGNGEPGTGYRNIVIPPVTSTTVDGLMLRDVGAMVADADTLVYLCDDHALHPGFGEALRAFPNREDLPWGVIVPERYTIREGEWIALNMGFEEGYCGGHGMIVRRSWIQRVPWLTAPRHPNWDLLYSEMLQAAGCLFLDASSDLAIEDVEPGATPWV